MTDEDVVRRYARTIGIGRVTEPRQRPDRKKQWQWRAFGAAAMAHLDVPDRSRIDDAARQSAEETPLGGTVAVYYPGRRGTIFALEAWVRGGTFHRYGVGAIDALVKELGLADAVHEMNLWKGDLKIDGEMIGYAPIGMRWSVSYRRAGGIADESGGCSGYSTPEDAAYVCLSAIEEAEREAYLESLVVGVA